MLRWTALSSLRTDLAGGNHHLCRIPARTTLNISLLTISLISIATALKTTEMHDPCDPLIDIVTSILVVVVETRALPSKDTLRLSASFLDSLLLSYDQCTL
jgi:hypothetical protein